MEIGIVGLPNVGKSTLFNALTKAGAASSNYPFTTIDPNVGVVPIPDKRLDALFEIFKPPKKVASYIKFVDIAGLMKGASQGEGLGNKFLANIREVDAIVQVVRVFDNPDVVHVLGEVDPIRDIEVIETELMLADLEAVDKMIDKNSGNLRSGSKDAKERQEKLDKIKKLLAGGKPAKDAGYTIEEVRDFNLLTVKPVFFVANTSETPNSAVQAKLRDFIKSRGAILVEISAKIESELIELPDEEKAAFMKDLGEEYTGLEKMIIAGQKLLNLIAFFTVGSEDEVRAWSLRRGLKAPQAAGRIHTDFEKGFIRAEVYSFDDLVKYRDEKILKEKGLIRSEGKEYVMKDGDICFFKFNV
ncbi:MAG: redox-regulated ATPase YchF [Elusimicrobia bacterium GWC2_51_8]|nr:MAG: redox-regulated ATPase YchF [Elusimicrobia bacterium GWA2_51_34]OGR62502.1 MAG: redox-regulated ATPase YchF [Elusimicrobia bacterium GWC2_51_8]OGR86197.1 MAG: redox-regulated ATPase YchF [Elusimicrobia bacterium GWF2_52_66]HAF96248.1 redox-regulated ATPase YchF [Elusimicrobiota bacterium]HCE97858.1 redox-regulated ATPase YchF [Elusimicrobiota bacterium]